MSKKFLLDSYLVDAASAYNVSVENLIKSLDKLLDMITFNDNGFVVLFEKVDTIIKALGEIATRYAIHGDKAAYALAYFYEHIPDNADLVQCITSGKYEKEMQRAILQANLEELWT